MARHKQHQILLVSNNGQAQPPFPGGWALAIFDAVNAFAPDLAGRHKLQTSKRTQDRLKSGKPVKADTYEPIEVCLIKLVTTLFPKVSATNDFARKYVTEYFRLWEQAGGIARTWAEHQGWKPQPSGVLARALLRDLVLRLCYLESCERLLSGKRFKAAELKLLSHHMPKQVYDELIAKRKKRDMCSQESLAHGLGVYDKKLQRLKAGTYPPPWSLLKKLAAPRQGVRVLAGIGFMDALARELGLDEAQMHTEMYQAASTFLSNHHNVILTHYDSTPFKIFAARGENLLLHPGLEFLWERMPDALWRTHIISLQVARIVDLAQAYFQYDRPEIDGELKRFFDNAEQKSGASPYGWMQELKHHKDAV